MLKKLVKYGNSNALVLDKAILELLNIEEGCLVKIKTDGKSIIITAHEAPNSQTKVTPTITHQETLRETSVKEMLKQYPHVDSTQKNLFTQELSSYQKEIIDTANAIDKKIKDISEQHLDTQSDVYNKEIVDLKNTLGTKINQLTQKMTTLPDKYGLHNNISEQQLATMQADFAQHFQKHTDTQTKLMNIINNPEYIHELQLLSEKHVANNGDSAEYIRATREVLWKYVPEARQADEELATIAKKYDSSK